MLKSSVIGSLLAAMATLPAIAQESYVVGLTGAMTGPAASTLGPAVEGLRLYVDKLNASGGVNGHKIQLILQDDSAEPSKAAANVKRILSQDNVSLLINASLSSTYAPMLAETHSAQVPVLYMGAVCPKEVLPPKPDPLQFCSTGFAQGYDSRAALAYIKEVAKGPVDLALVAMAIPVSRAEIDFAEGQTAALGFKAVAKEVIPPPTPDYTPFASKIKDAGANWTFSWAPWVTEVRTFEALRRLDWQGEYLSIAHVEAEGELPRLKDAKFYVMGANSMFVDGSPIHTEITEATKASSSKYPASQMTEGWLGGLAIEAALKKVGWPAAPEKVAAAMTDLNVDTKGLRGVPMVWTKSNHFRTKQAYRVYGWDGSKITVRKNWFIYDVE
jgi:branched-chain amino acid transport system substrate-binding protein